MAKLTVIIGYCGSGKTTLLESLAQLSGGRVLTMDEGFANPGNTRDHTERASMRRRRAAIGAAWKTAPRGARRQSDQLGDTPSLPPPTRQKEAP
jgi:ABC-type cobalamin/Fe3+-siderophores transport system ATPase subunit